MKRQLMAASLGVVIAISFLPAAVLAADQPTPAPIPIQILTAKRVFVANAGGDEWSHGEAPYSDSADRAYNEFYAALRSWGRFELVAAPADADLLFELRFSIHPAERTVLRGDSVGAARFDPQFRLVVRDPKTNGVLWGLTEHVQWAILQGNRDKNFSQGLAKLVAEVRRVATPSATATDDLKKQ